MKCCDHEEGDAVAACRHCRKDLRPLLSPCLCGDCAQILRDQQAEERRPASLLPTAPLHPLRLEADHLSAGLCIPRHLRHPLALETLGTGQQDPCRRSCISRPGYSLPSGSCKPSPGSIGGMRRDCGRPPRPLRLEVMSMRGLPDRPACPPPGEGGDVRRQNAAGLHQRGGLPP